MSRFFCLVFLSFCIFNSWGQDEVKSVGDTVVNNTDSYVYVQTEEDSILLMNGKYRYGFVDSAGVHDLHYSFNKKIALGKVYSYSMGGVNKIHYSNRSIDYLTQEQMRTLITGKQIGLKQYDNKAIIVSSFLLSLSSSVFDTYESINDPLKNPDFTSPQFSGDRFFAREPSFAQLLMPFTYTFTINAFKPRLKSKHLSNQNYLENELVIEGFQTTAKRKKFYGAMFSGIAGTLTGLLGYAIFKP